MSSLEALLLPLNFTGFFNLPESGRTLSAAGVRQA
jgi:hypothetical protein